MTHALRRYRADTRMTLDELAKAAGTTKGYLSRIETWSVQPSVRVIKAIITATNGAVSANDFFSDGPTSDALAGVSLQQPETSPVSAEVPGE